MELLLLLVLLLLLLLLLDGAALRRLTESAFVRSLSSMALLLSLLCLVAGKWD